MRKKRETKSAFGRKPPLISAFIPVGPIPEIPPRVVGVVLPVVVVVGVRVPVLGVADVGVVPAVLRE